MKGINFRSIFSIPNLISYSRILFGLMMLVMWHYEFSNLSILFVGIPAGFTDFLDGFIARKLGLTSRVGELVDPLCDKFLMACAGLIVFEEIGYLTAWITIILEGIFTIGPIFGAIFTKESLASLLPGKIKFNFQCLGILLIFLGQPELGNYSLISAIPFAIITLFMVLAKIIMVVVKYFGRTKQ